jgi:dihydropyrimidinase
VPIGIPGVAARLPILFSEGVMKGRIDINRFVALTLTNHARVYRLYPQKGTIAIGADANIVIWDPDARQILTHDLLHDGADYTPYQGLEITGWSVLTMVRGRIVVRDGRLEGDKGYGRHLPRERSALA